MCKILHMNAHTHTQTDGSVFKTSTTDGNNLFGGTTNLYLAIYGHHPPINTENTENYTEYTKNTGNTGNVEN